MKISRIISLTILILAVTALLMALWPPGAARIPASEQSARSFDEKITSLALAHQGGSAQVAHITETELTSKLEESIDEAASAGGNVHLKAVSLHLEDYEFVGIFTVSVYGKDLYMTLAGTLGVADGRLQVQLSGAKLGRLPIPALAFRRRLEGQLGSSESGDPLRLPDFIKDVHIENSELLVQAR